MPKSLRFSVPVVSVIHLIAFEKKNGLSYAMKVRKSSDFGYNFQVLALSNLTLLLFQDSEFDPLKFTSVIECEKPNNDLSRFRGHM